MGQRFSHAQRCVMFCALLKDQKMPDLSKFAWDMCLVCEGVKNQDDLDCSSSLLAQNGFVGNDRQVNRQPATELAFV